MDVITYLLELIETRKSVGINALGSLYKKKTPGRYDSETHSFLPPKYEISFTTEVKEDQELAHFICEKKNISIESANYYISEFVEKIHAQLADHQQADFSPLGELKLINDQIVLEVSEAKEVGFDFYGLPSVALHQTQETLNEPKASSELEKEPNEEIEESKSNTEEQPVTPTPITDPLWRPTVISRYEYGDDENEKKGRGMRIFLKIVLILLIIAAIAGATVYFLFPNLYYSVKESFSNQQVESQPAITLDTNSNQSIDSAVVDTVKEIIALPKDSLTVTTPIYEVIGSAMKTHKKVDEVISKLIKRGISAKKMESLPGRLIKISLGTFTDYKMARKFQDSLKIKLRNPDIYIETIKPKN